MPTQSWNTTRPCESVYTPTSTDSPMRTRLQTKTRAGRADGGDHPARPDSPRSRKTEIAANVEHGGERASTRD